MQSERDSEPHVYWNKCCAGKNYGDMITPYIVGKLRGTPVVDAAHGSARVLFGAGSIMRFVNKFTGHVTVMGSGVISDKERFRQPERVVRVRGPLTRKRFLEQGYACPEKYGDIGLLMPRVYAPGAAPGKEFRVGIIPHYVDYAQCIGMFRGVEGVAVIDVRKGVEAVTDRIRSCRCTLSSSLHGIIVSHAYGIPCAWIRLSDQIFDDNTKYHDYYGSLEVPRYAEVKPVMGLTARMSAHELEGIVSSYVNPQFPIDTDDLLEDMKLCVSTASD